MTHPTIDRDGRPADRTDWARVDATTDEEIAAQIAADPDTAPDMTEALLSGAATVTWPAPDIARLRGRFGLTQKAFAERLGVRQALVADWEQARRRPSGAARSLLLVVDRLGWAALDAIAGRRDAGR